MPCSPPEQHTASSLAHAGKSETKPASPIRQQNSKSSGSSLRALLSDTATSLDLDGRILKDLVGIINKHFNVDMHELRSRRGAALAFLDRVLQQASLQPRTVDQRRHGSHEAELVDFPGFKSIDSDTLLFRQHITAVQRTFLKILQDRRGCARGPGWSQVILLLKHATVHRMRYLAFAGATQICSNWFQKSCPEIRRSQVRSRHYRCPTLRLPCCVSIQWLI